MKKIYFFILFSLVASAVAQATPAQVILIRHGEKPDSGPDLNARGYQRANALVGFFETNPAVREFGTPVAIYAMGLMGGADATSNDDSSSKRPIETVTPLAHALGLSIQEKFTKDQVDLAVQEIMSDPSYDGKMVLICWEHKMIPVFAQAFGASMAPSDWDGGDVFDRAWVITFTGSRVSNFQDLPQHLLPGDSIN